MDEADVVERILALLEDREAEAHCRAMAARFHEALKKANPDLTETQMAAYDAAFEREFGELKAAAAQARLNALKKNLTLQDLAVLGLIVGSPDGAVIIQTIRKLGGVLSRATQEAMRAPGVLAHKRSAEAAFEAP